MEQSGLLGVQRKVLKCIKVDFEWVKAWLLQRKDPVQRIARQRKPSRPCKQQSLFSIHHKPENTRWYLLKYLYFYVYLYMFISYTIRKDMIYHDDFCVEIQPLFVSSPGNAWEAAARGQATTCYHGHPAAGRRKGRRKRQREGRRDGGASCWDLYILNLCHELVGVDEKTFLMKHFVRFAVRSNDSIQGFSVDQFGRVHRLVMDSLTVMAHCCWWCFVRALSCYSKGWRLLDLFLEDCTLIRPRKINLEWKKWRRKGMYPTNRKAWENLLPINVLGASVGMLFCLTRRERKRERHGAQL